MVVHTLLCSPERREESERALFFVAYEVLVEIWYTGGHRDADIEQILYPTIFKILYTRAHFSLIEESLLGGNHGTLLRTAR